MRRLLRFFLLACMLHPGAWGFLVDGAAMGAAPGCPPSPSRRALIDRVGSFAAVLDEPDVHSLLQAPFDLMIIDPTRTGSGAQPLRRREVQALQCEGPGGRRLVLAYLNIGEAERYRSYWRESFTREPPAWLGPPERGWPGHYKVRYWDPRWRRLLLDPERGEIARILRQGFDGVYLDRIDTMEFWGQRRGLSYEEARRRMATLVLDIRRTLDWIGGADESRPLLVIQNPGDLGREPGILDAVDAVGVEDLFRVGNRREPRRRTRVRLREIRRFHECGRTVLAIGYPSRPARIRDFVKRIRHEGFVPYVGRTDLRRVRYHLVPFRESYRSQTTSTP